MSWTWYQWAGAGIFALIIFYIVCRLAFLAYFISKRQAGANRRKDT